MICCQIATQFASCKHTLSFLTHHTNTCTYNQKCLRGFQEGNPSKSSFLRIWSRFEGHLACSSNIAIDSEPNGIVYYTSAADSTSGLMICAHSASARTITKALCAELLSSRGGDKQKAIGWNGIFSNNDTFTKPTQQQRGLQHLGLCLHSLKQF